MENRRLDARFIRQIRVKLKKRKKEERNIVHQHPKEACGLKEKAKMFSGKAKKKRKIMVTLVTSREVK